MDTNEEICKSLLSGKMYYFHGPGGTGKTYRMKEIVRHLREGEKDCIIVTLANKAAENLEINGAMGLFRAFGLIPDDNSNIPKSKLDILCQSARRCIRGTTDPLWDTKASTDDDKKRWYSLRTCLPRGFRITSATDRDIIRNIDKEKAKFLILDCVEVYERMTTSSILVIDEIGQIPKEMLEFLDSYLRKYRGIDEVMGGMGMLVLGDPAQTAPIKGDFFFQWSEWDKVKVCLFNEAKRFTSQDDIKMLLELRLGHVSDETDKFLRSRCIEGITTVNNMKMCSTRKEAVDYNNKELGKLVSNNKQNVYAVRCKDIPYHVSKDLDGNEKFSEMLPENANVILRSIKPDDIADQTELEEVLRIAIGARVMNHHNNRELDIYNGYMGSIYDIIYVPPENSTSKGKLESVWIEFDKEKKYDIDLFDKDITKDIVTTTVRGKHRILDISGNTVTCRDIINIERLKVKYRRSNVCIERCQFPFKLGWAFTIHKVQGMTIRCPAELDLTKCRSPGAAYVGVSRFENLSLMILKGYSRDAFKIHPLVMEFEKKVMNGDTWEYVEEMPCERVYDVDSDEEMEERIRAGEGLL